ncbi:MAG: phosphopantetheine-binding protein [Legionellaceae bacterium]|nr:phosphopantetheine-binding protein [Legionellaceae bacterium]
MTAQLLERMDILLQLPVGTLSGGEQLEDLDSWDSLSILEFIAVANEEFSKKVAPTTINEAETINDLIVLLQKVDGH